MLVDVLKSLLQRGVYGEQFAVEPVGGCEVDVEQQLFNHIFQQQTQIVAMEVLAEKIYPLKQLYNGIVAVVIDVVQIFGDPLEHPVGQHRFIEQNVITLIVAVAVKHDSVGDIGAEQDQAVFSEFVDLVTDYSGNGPAFDKNQLTHIVDVKVRLDVVHGGGDGGVAAIYNVILIG